MNRYEQFDYEISSRFLLFFDWVIIVIFFMEATVRGSFPDILPSAKYVLYN